jgi:serine/threonine protein phosphatase PrpC
VGVECIMKNALHRRSLDNVTIVIVAFNGFKKAIEEIKGSLTSTPSTIDKSVALI